MTRPARFPVLLALLLPLILAPGSSASPESAPEFSPEPGSLVQVIPPPPALELEIVRTI